GVADVAAGVGPLRRQVPRPALAVGERVVGAQVSQRTLGVGVEGRVGGPHVDEAGGGAVARDDLGGEHGALGLHRHVGAVVVPALVAPQAFDPVVVRGAVDGAVGVDVGD